MPEVADRFNVAECIPDAAAAPLPIDAAGGPVPVEQWVERTDVCDQVYRSWCELRQEKLTLHMLQTFYARHKYLIMSRHIGTYQQLGSLLAQPDVPLNELADRVIALMMAALQRPATRAGHTNVLQHIRGYLKRVLNKDEKHALNEAIEQYRCGEVSLDLPMALLREHFRRHPDTYIEQQLFMQQHLDTTSEESPLSKLR